MCTAMEVIGDEMVGGGECVQQWRSQEVVVSVYSNGGHGKWAHAATGERIRGSMTHNTYAAYMYTSMVLQRHLVRQGTYLGKTLVTSMQRFPAQDVLPSRNRGDN